MRINQTNSHRTIHPYTRRNSVRKGRVCFHQWSTVRRYRLEFCLPFSPKPGGILNAVLKVNRHVWTGDKYPRAQKAPRISLCVDESWCGSIRLIENVLRSRPLLPRLSPLTESRSVWSARAASLPTHPLCCLQGLLFSSDFIESQVKPGKRVIEITGFGENRMI